MSGTGSPHRRWKRWALIASLALNVLFVGLVVGAVLRGPPDQAIGGPGLWRYAHALPDPYRRELVRTVRRSRSDWGAQRVALRDARGALAEALRAQPFDIDAVATVLANEQRLAGQLADRGNTLLLEQIARMSAEDRSRYADSIQRRRHTHR